MTLAAGVPSPLVDATDPQVAVGAHRQAVTLYQGRVKESWILALELREITTRGRIQKELALKDLGPDGDPSRLAAGGSDSQDEGDEHPKVDELVLGEIGEEEFGALTG
jgi:hypothetical protein